MSDNPYQTPDAELETIGTAGELKLGQPKSVSPGRGWGWIADGFGYFKKSPGAWIGAVVVWFVIVLVLNLIPLIGQLAFMLTAYVWMAGFMLGCRDQDEGKGFQFTHLFAGFSNKVGKLILLSVVVAVISMAVMFMTMGSMYFSMITGDPAASQEIMNDFAGFWLSILFAMLIMLPLMMAIWFAPALIVLNDVSIGEAMKLSFIGCLKNIVPFLIYGVIGIILYVVAMIPLLLGLLVLGPVIIASIYVGYKDIFIES
jgi:hypothetical protein